MGDESSRRVDDALSALVQRFFTSSSDEDVIVPENRRREALDLARSIIDGSFLPNASECSRAKRSHSHGTTAVVSDINHASDLIKKKRMARFPRPIDTQFMLTYPSPPRERVARQSCSILESLRPPPHTACCVPEVGRTVSPISARGYG